MNEFYYKAVYFFYELFIPLGLIFSFTLGSCIGSFLNVCIWRIPRGENLNHPRSHCPKCNYAIPSYENIPILAWLILGGKCKNCRESISPRYIIIEAVTGLIFALFTYRASLIYFPIEYLLTIYFLISAFIAISFIDITHLIIPRIITMSGTIFAFILAIIAPYAIIYPRHEFITQYRLDQIWLSEKFNWLINQPRVFAFIYSLMGFIVGYVIVWVIVELGKILFGKQKFNYAEPITIHINKDGAQSVGDELLSWDEMFDRPNDKLVIEVIEGEWSSENESRKIENTTLTIGQNGLLIDDSLVKLSELPEMKLSTKKFTVPREAMGRGDIKMLAMIGAFLGPLGAIISLMIGTLAGTLFSLIGLVLGKINKTKQIPFGPFIALGATFWMLFWPEIIIAYKQFLEILSQWLGDFL